MAALISPASSDISGWGEELRAERDLVDDPTFDPWAEATDRADA